MHGVRMAFEALASAHKESSSSAQDSSDMQGKEDCGAKPDSRRKKRNNPEIVRDRLLRLYDLHNV